ALRAGLVRSRAHHARPPPPIDAAEATRPGRSPQGPPPGWRASRRGLRASPHRAHAARGTHVPPVRRRGGDGREPARRAARPRARSGLRRRGGDGALEHSVRDAHVPARGGTVVVDRTTARRPCSTPAGDIAIPVAWKAAVARESDADSWSTPW